MLKQINLDFDHLPDAIVITADGRTLTADPTNQICFTKKELQEIIGSKNLAYRSTVDNRLIVIDQVGDLKPDRRVNVRATLLYVNGHLHPIYNKVIVLKRKMIYLYHGISTSEQSIQNR